LLNEPPAPPWVQDTTPVGADTVPEAVSTTVAVKAIVPPVAAVDGLGDIAMAVDRCEEESTVSDDVPELAACVESPE